MFSQRKWKEGEELDSFLTSLKLLVRNCDHFAVFCKVRNVRSLQCNSESDDDCFEINSLKIVGVDSVYVADKISQQNCVSGKNEWKERVKIQDRYMFRCENLYSFRVDFQSTPLLGLTGRSELRFVKGIHTAKQLLRKCNDTNCDYKEALREYRNTSIPGLGASPSKILNCLLVYTHLPTTVMSLKSKVQNRKWYNRRAGRTEVAFDVGYNIVDRTSKDKYWETRKIVGKHEVPQSYWALKVTKGMSYGEPPLN
ncbi:hypothetical protein PR048_027827 [Dryococelus australis]|uniref:Uncharacterized protein n=1 Tax=Dryococelus australis TaxID=614101 RepID=A0ABQ9GHK9_9NEOP|nr:hypothetical protein PR048_027827 [Dryococelus australis]